MAGTITSLSGLPSWLSMPTLPVSSPPTPDALMAIDREPKRALSRIDDDFAEGMDGVERREGSSGGGGGRVRIKPQSRPRSYHDLLEDFENHEHGKDGSAGPLPLLDDAEPASDSDEKGAAAASLPPPPPPREDTARRSKRFSVPALALQTTSVTARTTAAGAGEEPGSGGGRSKRFSLVLGRSGHGNGRVPQGEALHGSSRDLHGDEGSGGNGKSDLGRGVAASRLTELLRKKS